MANLATLPLFDSASLSRRRYTPIRPISLVLPLVVAAVPAIIALDHGGVLPWTMWVASLVGITAMVVGGLVSLFRSSKDRRASSGTLLLVILIGLMIGLGYLQTIRLPLSQLSWLSPASHQAYVEWLAPIHDAAPELRQANGNSHGLISLAPWLTSGRTAWLMVLAGFALIAPICFARRSDIQVLLCVFAGMTLLHAAIGLYLQYLESSQELPAAAAAVSENLAGGKPFGMFVNRNNAAVLLNLGIGCGLGLVAWRASVLTGWAHRSLAHVLHSLRETGTDTFALFGLAAVLIGFFGLLASGSRGGLLGGTVALMISFWAFSSLTTARLTWMACCLTALIAVTAAASLMTASESLDRITDSAQSGSIVEQITENARWRHGADGLRTLSHHWLVGAGLGAYGYAYLPFQKSSPGEWFRRADNLWLEWPVESGLIGTLVLLAMFALLARALVKLRHSSAPLDHGLCVAGWFAVISMFVSQSFDFGLSLSAASLAMILLCGAILVRADQLPRVSYRKQKGDSRSRKARKSTFRSLTKAVFRPAGRVWNLWLKVFRQIRRMLQARYVYPFVFCLTLAGLVLAQQTLREHAASDNLVRSAKQNQMHTSQSSEGETFQTIKLDLSQHCETHPRDFAARAMLADVLNAELSERVRRQTQRPINRFDFEELSRASTLASFQSLRWCPLAPEIRLRWTRMPRISPSQQQRTEVLSQVARLRRQNFRVLRQVAKTAAWLGDWQLAKSAWRRAIQVDLIQARETMLEAVRVVAQAQPSPPIRLADLVPERPDPMTIAARIEIGQKDPDVEFLARALKVIEANPPADPKRAAESLAVLGQIELVRGDPDAAANHFESSLMLNRDNEMVQYELVRALNTAGKTDSAVDRAVQLLRSNPHNKRLAKWLESQ